MVLVFGSEIFMPKDYESSEVEAADRRTDCRSPSVHGLDRRSPSEQ